MQRRVGDGRVGLTVPGDVSVRRRSALAARKRGRDRRPAEHLTLGRGRMQPGSLRGRVADDRATRQRHLSSMSDVRAVPDPSAGARSAARRPCAVGETVGPDAPEPRLVHALRHGGRAAALRHAAAVFEERRMSTA